MGGKDLQVDWLPVNSLVTSCDPCRLSFNFLFDRRKVLKLAAGLVVEFSPFVLAGDTGCGVWNMDLIVIGQVITLARDVDKLQDQGTASNDAAAAW